MGGAVWLIVTLLLNVPGGYTGIMDTVHKIDLAEGTNHLHVFEWKMNIFMMTGPIVVIGSFLGFMQDYGCDQVTVQRLMATRTFRGMAKAVISNSFFDLIGIGLLLFVGLGMLAYFNQSAEVLPKEILANPDQVLPYYIMHALPVGVSGLVITAIFAAAMSSMDSGINSLSTVIVNDFVQPLRKKVRSEHHDVNLARILTLGLGAFAIGVACFASTIKRILEASSFFLGLFAAPILVIFLLGIFTRRANFRGWLVGTLVSIPVIVWLKYGPGVHFSYYFPFSFGITLIVGYIMSVIIGGPQAPVELTIKGRSQLKLL